MALLVLGLLGVLGALAAAALAAGPDAGTLRYEWSIGDRYGLDANGDRVVDNHDGVTNLAADKDFVQRPTYALTFDTCASPAVTERNELIKAYRVTLTGPETVTKSATTCKVTANVTKVGTYMAKVELISELGTVYDTRTETIEPKDHLVVSVGDSVASGEGNPDRLEPALPTFNPVWQNKQCHRTGLAGTAQAALRMERRDPHSSVTFVHLACSGAGIEQGLIGSYKGIEPAPGDPLPPQLDVLEDLVGGRQVDALLVSIGANDAKFSEVVKTCLMVKDCHTASIPGKPNAKEQFDESIKNLDRSYPLLDARLDQLATSQAGKPPVLSGQAFFTQYHDVTKNDAGAYCTGQTQKEIDAGRLPDGSNTDGISRAEMEWADTYVQDGINSKVKTKIDAANATGGSSWVWVDGIKPKFSTHGYCAADRWVRTLTESGLYQRGIHGAFHPNAEGHLYGYATSIEERVAPVLGVGGTALPLEPDAAALAAGESLQSWIGVLDKTGGLDAIANALPFGARDAVQTWIRDDFFGEILPFLQQKVVQAAGPLTALSERLDDLDGDGNPDVDWRGPGAELDVSGDIQPKLPSPQYDITLRFKGSVGLESDLALKAADLGLTGQLVAGRAAFDHTVKLHLDLTKPLADPGRLTIRKEGLTGTIKVGLGADFGGTDGPTNGTDRPPLSLTAGVLGLTATGPANANVDLAYKVQDPNGDGRIDATEMANPLDWVRFSCTGGAADVNLTARAALAGLPVEVGTVKVQDANVCDGVDAPQVDFSKLGELQSLTPADLINGLAQLTQSLRSIQQTADVDLPFVKESLSGIISVNDRLVRFFVDAGLTDPANPMASITFDPAKRPDLDTIGEVIPKVAEALGAPAGLNLRYDAGRLLFDVGISRAPAPLVGVGTLDVGDQLDRVGLVGVNGSARATVEPSFDLKVGFGIDLRPGLTFAQRFFVKVGAGPELTADAKVTADAQLKGTLALLDVTLADTNPGGPVTLLDRKDSAKPLLSVELDGKGDDQLTLAELTTPAAGAAAPVKVTITGQVPAFGLSATASLAGSPLAGGTVNVKWPDVTKTSGTEALSVTVDDTFAATLLPFAFDPENPRAVVGQVLTAAQRGVAGLRSVLAKDPELLAGLPLVGQSAADLDPVLATLDVRLAALVELSQSVTLEQAEAELERAIGEALEVANDRLAGLVTLRYEKQTPTANAALVADVALGLCTPDRAGPGCSNPAKTISRPFNLQLGQGADSPGLAGLEAGGAATVSFDAGLRLGVGVELPRVTAATTAGGVPTASGAPTLFVLDTSRFELGLGARAAGTLAATLGPVEVGLGTDAEPMTAALAARYKLASPSANPAAPVRKRAGNELTAWLATLDPDPATTGGVRDTVFPSGCAPDADACATLPVFVANSRLGVISFSAPELLKPAGWAVVGDKAVLDNLGSQAFQFSVLVRGIESLSKRMEASLRNLPQGTQIPLLGGDPTAGADVLRDFNTGVVTPFAELVGALQSKSTAKAVRDEVQGFLYPKVGPGSVVKLLKDTNGNGSVTKDDIVVDLTCKVGTAAPRACADTDSVLDLQDIQIKAKLAKEATTTGAPFDSGFPGLRITSKDGITASIGFEIDLAVGMDRTNGFYVRTNAFGTAPELRVVAQVSLPKSPIDAEIAFLPVTATDLRPDAPDVRASLGLDLALGGNDGKMGLGQIGQATLTPRFEACANVQLGLVTGGGAGEGTGKLPSLVADLKLAGGLSCTGDTTIGAAPASSFTIAFDNVGINIGTFLNDFIGPAVRTIRQYTGPLEPTIDAIRQPIPGVAEAARAVGQPEPTWWDLLNAVNEVGKAAGQGDQLQIVKTVMFVSDLVRSLDGANGASGVIPLGDFDLNVGLASQPTSGDQVGKLLTNIFETPGGSVINRLPGSGVKDKLKDTQSGITFPAFERPQLLFQLLIGKDVPLVRFEAAGSFLHVPVGPFAFPVGPVTVYFGGSLDVSGHFAAGYDTYGIRQVYARLSDDDPTNDGFGDLAGSLLNGFYFDDYDANGKDVPELKVAAEVVVGAGAGVPGFGIFVEGGVGAQATLDLNTGDDGKLRAPQIIAQLKKNPNPVCIFTAAAHVGAFVRLVVTTPFGDLQFPIADVTILDEPDLTSFCNTQQEPPQPPDPGTDVQKMQTGLLYADGLLQVTASPVSDHITVTALGAGVVEVSTLSTSERINGVSRVFADGGAGDDMIKVSGDPSLEVTLCGGPGRDQLTTTGPPGALHGDNGPGVATVVNGEATSLPCTTGPGAADTLTGAAGNDVLDGGPGNDTLLGGDGDDQLTGGADNDVLQPGGGDDRLNGGEGNDVVSSQDRRAAGLPGITTNLRTRTSGATGTTEHDDLVSVEIAYGSPGADRLLAPDAPTLLDGGAGNDTLTGGSGNDTLLAGAGDDVLLGGAGTDALLGLGGDDRIVGGSGPDLHQGGSGNDVSDWTTEPGPVLITLNGQPDDGSSTGPAAAEKLKDNVNTDIEAVWATPADDELRAGATSATLEGGDGNDLLVGPGLLFGQNGDDRLRGGAASDEVLGGGPGNDHLEGMGGPDDLRGDEGDDTLDGGYGTDRMSGGPGLDTVDYSTRPSGIDLTLNGVDLTGRTRTHEVRSQPHDGQSEISSPDCGPPVLRFGHFAGRLWCDEILDDVERILGGQGDDDMKGSNRGEVFITGTGNDYVGGYGGVDHFDGGPGNDTLYDNDTMEYDQVNAPGHDTFIGGDGDDIFDGYGGDTIDAGAGNDRIRTFDGDNVILAGPGNDGVTVGDDAGRVRGNDVIDLGDGDNTAFLGSGTKHVTAGKDRDTVISLTDATTFVELNGGDDSFTGEDGVDTVDGGPGDDRIDGRVGDDRLTDLEGANTIEGAAGNDVLRTGPGSDLVHGGDGDDDIMDAGWEVPGRNGMGGTQRLSGEAGNDVIRWVGGSLSGSVLGELNGDAGDDRLFDGPGRDALYGGDGNDLLDGGGGDDILNGHGGDDTLLGGPGDDVLEGQSGTNLLDGGVGADTFADRSGGGVDTLTYEGRTEPLSVTQGPPTVLGNDGGAFDESATVPGKRDEVGRNIERIIGGRGDDHLSLSNLWTGMVGALEGRSGNDMLTASTLTTGPVTVLGGEGDDTVVGGAANDTLQGGPGGDLLRGGPGADVVQGEDGDDLLDEGLAASGADRLSGGDGVDSVDYSGRTAAVSVTIGNGAADDGEATEADEIVDAESARIGAGQAPPKSPVTLTAAKTSSVSSETVTWTAVVSQPAGQPAATGSVVLSDGDVVRSFPLDATGRAVMPYALVTVGNRTVTAAYSGDARYAASTSAGVAHTVAKVGMTTTLSVVRTPVPTGTQVEVVAAVIPVTGMAGPTAGLPVKEAGATIGTISLSNGRGTGTFTLPVGSHELVGVWAGGTTTLPSTSAPVTAVVVDGGRAPVTLALSAVPATPVAGTELSLKATVTTGPGVPLPVGAQVTFTRPAAPAGAPAMVLGTATVGDDGTATLVLAAGLPGGSHPVTASLAGTTWTVPAQVTTTVLVERTPTTTTTLTSAANPSPVGRGLSLTAAVARTSGSGTPSGTVTFLDGDRQMATATLSGGTASVVVTLTPGDHGLTARYDGTERLAPSASTPLSQTIADPPPPTTTTLVREGDVLVATVTGPAPAITGSVRFVVDGTPAGTVAVDAAGRATLPVTGLTPGSHSVVAEYLGSATHSPSTSTALAVAVRAATSTALAREGDVLVATVSGPPAPLSGQVRFLLDGIPAAMVEVDASGRAAMPVTGLSPGIWTVVAEYLGSATHLPSASAPLTVQRQVAATTTLAREGDLLVATTTGPPPAITGQVRFVVDDGTPAATVTVDAAGRATMPVSALTPGTHTVVAQYLGSATHLGCVSSPLTVERKVPSATTLAREGELLAATVTGPAPAITGQVRFVVDGTPAATVAAGAAGRATLPLTGLTPGSHSVVAEYLGSATHLPSASTAVVVDVPARGSRFTALPPVRILDTRTGNGAPAATVGAKGVVELQVTGRGGVPADATAVVLNVTSVAMSGSPSSFLTAWPTGDPRPNASNLNYVAGQVIPNLVTVKVGVGGKVSLYNDTGSVHVLADVAGYYAAGAESAFNALQPTRILDTRTGNGAAAVPVGPGGVVDLQVTGRGGVPAGASGVVLNVTAVGLSGSPSSYVTAWPTATPAPNASNLNLVAGQVIPNLVVAKIGAGGKVSLRNDTGSVHLLADVAGYYGATGSTFTPVAPSRLLDTRTGTGAPAVRIPAGGTVELQVTGRSGVPDGATAVVLNVTAVNLTGAPASWLTAWPTGQPMPLASNLNMVAGEVIPNSVVAKIGTGGKVSISNAAGSVDVLADIAGYYTGA